MCLRTGKRKCHRWIIDHRYGYFVPGLESLIKKIPLTFQRNLNGLSLGDSAYELGEGCRSSRNRRFILSATVIITTRRLFSARLILRCAGRSQYTYPPRSEIRRVQDMNILNMRFIT